MKKIISLILAASMIFSLLTVAAKDSFPETEEVIAEFGEIVSVDENGRKIREAKEETVELYSEEKEVEITLPVKPKEEKSTKEESVELLSADSEKAVVVYDISSYDFYLSEDIITVELRLYSVYDAKYKLGLSLVDSDGNVVAKQTGCEYLYEKGGYLRYELEVVSGATITPYEDYSIDMKYTGEYNFICDTDYLSVYPEYSVDIIKAEILDKEKGIFALYVANLDNEGEYKVSYEGTLYEPLEIKDNCIKVQVDLMDNSDGAYNYAYLELYEIVNEEENYIDWVEIRYFNWSASSEEYEEYNGIDVDSKISTETESFWAYLFERENGLLYTEEDADNAEVYLIDSVTGNRVGSSYVEFDENYSEIDAEVTVNSTLVDGRIYLLVSDDGYTVRLNQILATSKPYIGFCGVKTANDSYSSGVIFNAEEYEYRLFNSYNISDLNKLSAAIYNSSGEEVVSFDKNSAGKSSSSIYFTMTRKETLTADDKYVFVLTYDGEIIYSRKLHYSNNTSSEEAYVDFYLYDAYKTDESIYAYGELYSDEYSADDFEYFIEDEEGNLIEGEYHNTLFDQYDCSYVVIKFDAEFSEDYYGDYYFTATLDGEELYSDDLWYSEVSLPFIYPEINTSEADYFYLYGEGLKDNSNYSLFVYDEITNEEKEISLTKVRGENTLKISADEISKYCFGERAILEIDGIYAGIITVWDLERLYIPENEFYAKYRTQNHKQALLGMPHAIYSKYKLADSEAALKNASFKDMERNVLYQLSDGDGEKVIYAQFKKSNGEVSDVMTAKVTLDTEPVEILKTSDLSGTYYMDKYGEVCFEHNITVNEPGNITYALYSDKGIMLDDRTRYLSEGENNRDFEFDCDGYGSMVNKIEFYITDLAGNVTETYSYDIEIVEKYSVYEERDGNELLYSLSVNNDTGMIEEAEVYASELVIPSKIGDVNVKGIADYAFKSCDELVSVTVSEGITSIGDGAFSYCYNLAEINLPETLTSIGYHAFYSTEYYDDYDNWEDNVLYISDYLIATKPRSLSGKYEIKEGTTVIAGEAFSNCVYLDEIVIPDSVIGIGNQAFYNCTKLTEIELPDSLTSIEEYTFHNCTALTKVMIPEGLKEIKEYAFRYCTNLPEITIPESVNEIGKSAFENCSGLTKITIPESVTEINAWTFYNCSELSEINLHDGITSIGHDAFYNTAYIKNTDNWEDEVIYIDNYLIKADGSTDLMEYAVKEGTTVIAGEAFLYCQKLESITIPESVISIGDRAFGSNYNVKTINYEGSRTSWNKIEFGEGNENFLSATVVYGKVASGDLNGDGAVDINDAVLLFRHSLMPDRYPLTYSGEVDFTGDGAVDINDAVLLFRHSLMPDRYPI